MQTTLILSSPFIHLTTNHFFKDHFAHVAPGLPPLSPSVPTLLHSFALYFHFLLGIERLSSQFPTQSSLIIVSVVLVSADTDALSTSPLLLLTYCFFLTCRLISFSFVGIVVQLVEMIANIYSLLHVYKFIQLKYLIRNFCSM